MKIRFPLFTRIVGWSFVNLLLIILLLAVVFKAQFRFGLDFLLGGRAGARVQTLAELISYDLNGADKGHWNEILERYGAAYQLRFYLFRNDGGQLGGPELRLPRLVHDRLLENRGPNSPRGRENPPDPEGVFRSPDRPERPAPLFPRPQGPPGERKPFAKSLLHTTDPSRYWLVLRIPVLDRDRDRPRPAPVTLLAESETLRGGGLFLDFVPWIWAGAGVIVISLVVWLPLVRGITKSIGQLTQTTEQIAEGHFDAVAPVRRRDELGRLGTAINGMATRLAGFVTGQKRFLGDIAHELCSPIARIQVGLGILEQRADPAQKAYVDDVREEVQHMSALVNELLSFSKAGLQPKEIQLVPVNLAEVASKVIAREAASAARIDVVIPADLSVLAEPDLLSRALANLLRNALRYAGSAGVIAVSARAEEGRVILAVSDEGPGVPEELLQQIFDPFYRIENSRSRETGGIGLGLAIVRTCVEACQGVVTARNRVPQGLEVRISLLAA